MDENKQKALSAALKQIEAQFGKGACMRLGDTPPEAIESISTGSMGVDIALGIGGLPRGRIVEIYGPESSGKTTLTLSTIAQAQKKGLTCAFVDAEHALDPEYASKLGVNVDDLLVSQPDTGEQALEITDMLVRSNAVDVIIVDSVAALVPKAEIEGEMGDMHVGLQARLMSQALRKITGNIKNANCLVIFINQIRMKIGVMFGSPETTTGGNALKFYASVRMDIRRTGSVKDGEEVIGSETRIKIVKNKMAPPFKQAETQIIYGQGFNRMSELVDLGVLHGFVEKSGAWYSYNGDKIGQGKANSAKYLSENPAVCTELENLVLNKVLGDKHIPLVAPAAKPAAMQQVKAAVKQIEVATPQTTSMPLGAAAKAAAQTADSAPSSSERELDDIFGASSATVSHALTGTGQDVAPTVDWFKQGIDSGVLSYSGPWVLFNSINLGRGQSVVDKVEGDTDLKFEILTAIKEKLLAEA
jgi:recombination protein RecA